MALKVLVVDDSPAVRKLVKRALDMSGIEIERTLEAPDGQEAVEILRTESVDLLLTDINMPVMNGEELLRTLAADPALPKPPSLVISTDASLKRREVMNELGVRGYITKPFVPEQLRDTIHAALSLGRLRDQVDTSAADMPISQALSLATEEVLESMFFIIPEEAPAESTEPGKTYTVSVPFRGDLARGRFIAELHLDSARVMASSYYGIEQWDIGETESRATVTELANMICGATLSKARPNGVFNLGSPIILPTLPPGTSDPAAEEARRAYHLDEGTLRVQLSYVAEA